MNHFAFFGLPERHAIDPAALEAAYRTLQSQVHPDRFAAATDAERRVAMQKAAQANEAYRVLRDPLQRALHLLALRGKDVRSESGTAVDGEFLARQLEWREAVEEAREARDAGALARLLDELAADRRERHARLGELLDGGDDGAAAEAARQLMFIEKLEQEIGDSLETIQAM